MNSHFILLAAIASVPVAVSPTDAPEKGALTVTVLYDNYAAAAGLETDWGFACLVTGGEKVILFDTGTRGPLLLENMKKLKVDPQLPEIIVISHNHRDHTGGLSSVLERKADVPVYLVASSSDELVQEVREQGGRVILSREPVEVCKDAFVTGQMGESIREQALVLNTDRGLIVITGCSHPGIVEMVRRAKEMLHKDVFLILGGFHLLRHSEAELETVIRQLKELGVRQAGPTHCTGEKAIERFRQAFGGDFVPMGVGKRLEIPAH